MDIDRDRGIMKTTLVIMAAGICSRFGGGIKQLAPVGLNGEIIMDYSIHDAIEAGFNKIVFMYAYNPIDTGKGIKAACLAWIRTFKNSLFFRKLFCLVFFTVMILFRMLLNRNMWMNPISNMMGGWWIWEKQSDGTVTLTTECFENIALMLPFTFLLMWTAKEKLLKAKGRQICFTSILWYSTKAAFLFSLTIEFLQLFLRLGTFQLSDLCYNTLGGAIGGVLYWMGWKVKK